jgi:hypothetical protein
MHEFSFGHGLSPFLTSVSSRSRHPIYPYHTEYYLHGQAVCPDDNHKRVVKIVFTREAFLRFGTSVPMQQSSDQFANCRCVVLPSDIQAVQEMHRS